MLPTSHGIISQAAKRPSTIVFAGTDLSTTNTADPHILNVPLSLPTGLGLTRHVIIGVLSRGHLVQIPISEVYLPAFGPATLIDTWESGTVAGGWFTAAAPTGSSIDIWVYPLIPMYPPPPFGWGWQAWVAVWEMDFEPLGSDVVWDVGGGRNFYTITRPAGVYQGRVYPLYITYQYSSAFQTPEIFMTSSPAGVDMLTSGGAPHQFHAAQHNNYLVQSAYTVEVFTPQGSLDPTLSNRSILGLHLT